MVVKNTPVDSVFANTAQDASVADIDLSPEGMNAAETIRASRRTNSCRISSISPTDASAEVHGSEKNAEASQRGQEGENDPKARELKQLFTYLNRLTDKQQKAIASAFNVTHAGVKKSRAARIYVILSSML